jgi:type II secretory pathway pseudopilin PulG
MAYGMPSRARQTQAEDGFILIEVLVSALILAIVAGAVLTLITATTHSAASQRAHAVAYGLAQEFQAKLRTKQIAALISLDEEKTENVGGTNYTVISQSVFVSNTSQKVSCSDKNDTPDYVRLTTTVSSSALVNPVTIRSVVSPTNGSLETGIGSLQFQTQNAAGKPVSGVQFELKGPHHSFRGTSESTGCASFGNIPAELYEVTSSAPGLVNKEGKSSATQKLEVPAVDVVRAQIFYDRPGSLQPEFVFLNSTSGALEPATVDSMEVFNSAAPISTPKLVGTPGGARLPTLKAESLYPFSKSKYTVYAGGCEQDNPDPTGTKTANDKAMGFAEVPPGGEPTTPLRIQLPALNLTVKYGTAEVSGAMVAVTDTKCNTKRTYTTNLAGHMSATTTGPTEAGLPWSTYKVCVAAKLADGKWRRYQTSSNKSVENLTTGMTLNVNLATEATVSETELKC